MVCLALPTILVVLGTLYQAKYGLYPAHNLFFDAWLVMLGGGLPFPAVRLVLLTLLANLLCGSFRLWRRRRRPWGLLLLHLGLLSFLFSAVVTAVQRREWELGIGVRPCDL